MRIKNRIRRYPRTVLTLIVVVALAVLALRTFEPPGQLLFQRTTDSGLQVLVQRQANGSEDDRDLGPRCPGGAHLAVRINDSSAQGVSLGETEVGEWPTELGRDSEGLLTAVALSYGSSPRGEISAAYAVVMTTPRVSAVRGQFMGKSDHMGTIGGLAVLAVRVSPPIDPRLRMTVEAFDASGQAIAKVDETGARQVGCVG